MPAFQSEIRPSEINELLEKTSNRNFGKYLAKLTLKKCRGFTSQTVSFDFPITALIGTNGGGKTTVLGAAACAYSATKPKSFFAKSGKYDASMQGWSIEYELIDKGINPKELVKRTATFTKSKWSRGAIERPVLFFGVSRTVPAHERKELAKCAKTTFEVPEAQVEGLTQDAAAAISRVLGKDVAGFRQLRIAKGGHTTLLTGKTKKDETYSEFHFGAGESSIIRMVLAIEAAEENSLVLIEEIENGLHPVAAVKMVEYLISVAKRKSIQTIFITHVRMANMDPHLLYTQVGRRLGLIPPETVAAAFVNVYAQNHISEINALVEPFKSELPIEAQNGQTNGVATA